MNCCGLKQPTIPRWEGVLDGLDSLAVSECDAGTADSHNGGLETAVASRVTKMAITRF